MSIFSSTELPQNSKDTSKRLEALADFKEKFQYDFSAIENVPIAASIPEEAKAGTGWSLKIVATEYNVRRNWEALVEENGYVFEKPLPQKPLTEIAGYLLNSDLVSILNYSDPNLGVALKRQAT